MDPALDSAGVKWGVRGEGSSAAGSPRSYTARIDLWHTGPSRARVLHEGGAPLSGGLLLNERNAIREQARPAGSLWLLGQPADRVSGQAKLRLDCPIAWSEVKPRQASRINMRTDYYVVSPNRRVAGGCTRVSSPCA